MEYGGKPNNQTEKIDRVIMQGDLYSAHPCCRWDYAQPLNKDIGVADNKLEHFLSSTGGALLRTTGAHMEGEGVPSGTGSRDHMELASPTPGRQPEP